jgi:hypothetical protein
MLTADAVLLQDNAHPHKAAHTQALLEHINRGRLTTLLTVMFLLQATTTCLPT